MGVSYKVECHMTFVYFDIPHLMPSLSFTSQLRVDN